VVTNAPPTRLLAVVLTAAVAVLLTSATSAGTTVAPDPGPSAPAPDPPSPPPTFGTLPPGSALPTGDACAALVADVPEPVPANAVYNATTGSRVLPAEVFDPVSNDPRAAADIASRVDGRYTGTTPQILQWAACKWGVDEKLVRAQAQLESSWRQAMMGDWTSDPALCAPDHGPGVDGRPGRCPESWGILQVRYHYFGPAFPDVIASTAFNVDTAYGIWRACFEGYEWWLRDTATDPYHPYRAGDALGCAGRWYSGRWYDRLAERYIYCLRRVMDGRQPCQ